MEYTVVFVQEKSLRKNQHFSYKIKICQDYDQTNETITSTTFTSLPTMKFKKL